MASDLDDAVAFFEKNQATKNAARAAKAKANRGTEKLSFKQIRLLIGLVDSYPTHRHHNCFQFGAGAGRTMTSLENKGLAYREACHNQNKIYGPLWWDTEKGQQWIADHMDEVKANLIEDGLFDEAGWIALGRSVNSTYEFPEKGAQNTTPQQ